MVTKEKFLNFLKVLDKNDYDIVTEASKIMNEANLNEDEYHNIQMNYSYYYDEYTD